MFDFVFPAFYRFNRSDDVHIHCGGAANPDLTGTISRIFANGTIRNLSVEILEKNVQFDLAGNYSCTISNILGTARADFQIVIQGQSVPLIYGIIIESFFIDIPDVIDSQSITVNITSFFTVDIKWEPSNNNFALSQFYNIDYTEPLIGTTTIPSLNEPFAVLTLPQDTNFILTVTSCNPVGCAQSSSSIVFLTVTPGKF